MLAGCGTPRPASVAEGLCAIAPAPEFQILGKTEAHDQPWIDDTTEALIAACGSPRPKPRPAEWDAAPEVVPLPAPAKRRSITEIIKGWGR